MTESKPTKYSRIMYNLMFKLHSADTISFSWCVYVENIISSTNFKDLWDNQSKFQKISKKIFLKFWTLSHISSGAKICFRVQNV